MSIADLLRPPPAPPDDPTFLRLDRRSGWRIAPGATAIEVAACDGAVTLAPLAGGARSLTEPGGSFGGLVPPVNVAVDPDGLVWLVDAATGALRRFDPCACAFVTVSCTAGRGPGARQLVDPVALAACGRNLLLVDRGTPGRVLVFARGSLALRAIWLPPAGAVPLPWRPNAVACDGRGRALVADIANGAVHVFERSGRWVAAWPGFGAVAAIAVDCDDRVYTMVPGESDVRISDSNGVEIERASRADAVADRFPRAPFAIARDGRFDLSGDCDAAGWFDRSGAPAASPPSEPAFPDHGSWTSRALDSRIARCQWHRVVLDARMPARTSIRFWTVTAETELPQAIVDALPDEAWQEVPRLGAVASEREALILSPPGRYMWLRAILRGRGDATPRLCEITVEFPRISLRRYLPAAFAPDPVAGEFADRLLAVFDRGFRSVESAIDESPALVDPRSTPASFLSWLAGWIGISFDRNWPEARRRRFLRAAARLYPCRGTPGGIRRALLLFVGLDDFTVPRRRACCAPPCTPPPPGWVPPPLLLEHWKLRRWLYLGAGRLGDAAVLWGETLLGRSQLGTSARLDVTRLDTTRDPMRDPFHAYSHAFTLFVPGRFGRTPRDRASVARLVAGETPAHVRAELRFVLPRMRVGVQASIGFDSVVGCWPEGIVLDAARLGRATVLSAGDPPDLGPRQPRIGSTSRVGPTLRLG